MGFGFRVAKGVRVYPGSRGISIGSGPVRYYTRLGGGGSSRGGSVAARERQLRQQARLDEVQQVIKLDQDLIHQCSLHKEDFAAPQAPKTVEPESVDQKALLKQLEQAALAGISALKFGERKAAKQKAREQLAAAVDSERHEREKTAMAENEEQADAWRKLQANNAEAVLATLEAAFADNDAPAAAVNCEDDRVDLVMRWPAVDHLVHERQSAVTPTGRPTTRKRTKTEIAELYLEAMCSNALATIKETFAVAPGINEAGMLIVRGREDPAVGRMVLEALFLAQLRRSDLEDVNWERVHPTATLLSLANGRVGMKGKNKQLQPLDVSGDSEIQEVIRRLARDLGWTAKENGIEGSALPGEVVIA